MPKNNRPDKIIFAGTPVFAATHLQVLHEAGFDIPLVLTQPDAQVGRGRKTTPTPVKAYALLQGLTVAQPEKLRDNQTLFHQLQDIQPDWMIVVAYGLIIPADILAIPKYGCLNVHGSLLPRWRGAAPVQRAIEAQDEKTGVCIMQMDEGLDTGAVRHRVETSIEDETAGELLDRLAPLGAEALLQVLDSPEAYPPVPQPLDGITYADKINKNEKQISWTQSAHALSAKIRALQPWPCVSVQAGRYDFKILQAHAARHQLEQPVGTVTNVDQSGISVAVGDGRDRLLIKRLQLAGGKPTAIKDFLNGKPDYFSKGDRFMDTVTE